MEKAELVEVSTWFSFAVSIIDAITAHWAAALLLPANDAFLRPECDQFDNSFNWIVVQVNAAVVQKPGQR